jgi:ribosomal protein S27AE
MVKIQILAKCENCHGEAYLPMGKDIDHRGFEYMRYRPCPKCGGSGMAAKWIELLEFMRLLQEARCPHEHVASSGGFHLKGGEIWDDIEETCSDCGEVLR